MENYSIKTVKTIRIFSESAAIATPHNRNSMLSAMSVAG